MKKIGVVILGGLVLVAMFCFARSHFWGSGSAFACGGMGSWGSSGGGDYVPHRRGSCALFANRAPGLTQEQAHDVVANQIKKLNPDLKIGRIHDQGSYYEAEVLGANGEVVQHLGVDKESGQVILIN